jgi:hypothetical protein
VPRVHAAQKRLRVARISPRLRWLVASTIKATWTGSSAGCLEQRPDNTATTEQICPRREATPKFIVAAMKNGGEAAENRTVRAFFYGSFIDTSNDCNVWGLFKVRHHLAQVNIARMRGHFSNPIMAGLARVDEMSELPHRLEHYRIA